MAQMVECSSNSSNSSNSPSESQPSKPKISIGSAQQSVPVNDVLSPTLSTTDSTPSLSVLMSPSSLPAFLSSNLAQSPYLKASIHHQDAEVSIADATDCLRMVSGKIDWFHRKQCFCPHLISTDDAAQIAALHQKILIEEVPFLELQTRLSNGLVVDIPRELEGRVQAVCGLFDELKQRIDDLITNIAPTIMAHH